MFFTLIDKFYPEYIGHHYLGYRDEFGRGAVGCLLVGDLLGNDGTADGRRYQTAVLWLARGNDTWLMNASSSLTTTMAY